MESSTVIFVVSFVDICLHTATVVTNPKVVTYSCAHSHTRNLPFTFLFLSFTRKVQEKLVKAGLLHEDGAELDMDDVGPGTVYNEVEVSDGYEACQLLRTSLDFDEVCHGMKISETVNRLN